MTVEPTDGETTMLIKRVDAAGPAAPGQGAPQAPPQTMADAMRAVSMPPLAGTVADTSAGTSAGAGTVAVVNGSATVQSPPTPTPTPTPTTTTAAVMPPPATEIITCPECGTTAQVTLNRRDSIDFCRTCDYPLFWTPSKIVRDPSDDTDESLRRLPGTVGRATIASLACPFCSEPNALSAQTCVRCHRPMHPVEEPPPPPPVYVAPPPPPAPVEEPVAKVSWWVWVLLALGAAALITLIVLIATHTIH